MADDPKEEKKDITSLIDLAKTYTPSASEKKKDTGMTTEIPIEKVDVWENLDEYAKNNPDEVKEPDPEPAPEPTPEPVPEFVAEPAAESAVAEPTEEMEIPAETPPEEPAPVEAIASEPAAEEVAAAAPESSDDFPTTESVPEATPEAVVEAAPAEEDPFAVSPPDGNSASANSGIDGLTAELNAPTPEAPVEAAPEEVVAEAPKPAPPPAAPKKAPPTAPVAAKPKSAVKPALPFSLMITGKLTDYEKAKLTDLLQRENYGIRETDLDPQFESGRVLIPQISEYAGILLVQALRGTSAEMKFGPADQIFASKDSVPEEEEDGAQESTTQISQESSLASHPAEDIPLLPDHSIDSIPNPEILGTLVTSAGLTSTMVEAPNSQEYLDTLEALKRQIQYKAFRKGAHAVVQLKIQLETLILPSMYRLTVMGVAIRPKIAETAADDHSPDAHP